MPGCGAPASSREGESSCDREPAAPRAPPSAAREQRTRPSASFATFRFLGVVVGHPLALVGFCSLVCLTFGHDAEHHASTGEVLVRHTLDVLGSDRERLLIRRAEVAGVVVIAGAVGELER